MRLRRVLFVAAAATVLLSCAPRNETPPSPSQPANAPRVSVPGKILNIAATNEPSPLAGKFAGSGQREYTGLFSAALVRLDYRDTPFPILAAEVPSAEKGSWKVLDNGRMETTYRLRDSLLWHDGAAFTAEDVAFTWRAIMHPDVPANRAPEAFIEGIDVMDPATLLIRWKEPYVYANAYEQIPMPRHILEPLLLQDAEAFRRSAYWTTEWVGLGPYRLAEWQTGSYLKGQAFPGYALGAPLIENVFIYFIADANQAMARVLAGTIDLTSGSVIKFDEGSVLKQEMEARGLGSVLPMRVGDSSRLADIQFREPVGPWARDVRARQAMAHALDRQLVVDTIHHGFTRIADTYLGPTDPTAAIADRVIRKYPYDPRRAEALLAEAGWSRGGDGMLSNSSGEHFDLEAWTSETAQFVKETEVFTDQWRGVGINARMSVLSRAVQNDAEQRSRFPGVLMGNASRVPQSMEKWSTNQIAGPANRWTGRNLGGYASDPATQLAGAFFKTLDPQQRAEVSAQFLKIITEDVATIFLYTQTDLSAVPRGLRGVLTPASPGDGWLTDNINTWYWES